MSGASAGEAPRPRIVLDASAILAHFEDEVGAEQVRQALRRAQGQWAEVYASLMNVGEVAYIVERERGLAEAQATLSAIEQLPIHLLDVTRERVLAAAHLKAHHAISYADAFAAAAAFELDAELLTGDGEFAVLAGALKIRWLGR